MRSPCGSASSRYATSTPSSGPVSSFRINRPWALPPAPYRIVPQTCETSPRGRQPAHPRSDRDAKRRSRLLISQALDIDEEDGLTLGFRQALHLAQHPSGGNIRFEKRRSIDGENRFRVDSAGTLAKPPGAEVVQPDRAQN